MTADLQAMESLLMEISELGAAAEDRGINRIPSFDPLLEKAQSLGIDVSLPTTLDDLREAVENACEVVRAKPSEAEHATNRISVTKYIDNEAGSFGDSF